METALRAALIGWLRSDPALSSQINIVAEEAPVRSNSPWLGIVASASVDWSVKALRGREVRIALELHLRGDDPATGVSLANAVEARIEALPASQPGFSVANITFLRSRGEQRTGNVRALLLEYRFRLLAA